MRLSAEAVLVSRGDRSLTEGLAQVTAETVDDFAPDDATKAEARRVLERLGFTVQDAGMSLTIEGERETFERTLGVRLDVSPEAAPGEAVVTLSGEPRLPAQARGLVEAVAFGKRAHLFGSPPGKQRESHG